MPTGQPSQTAQHAAGWHSSDLQTDEVARGTGHAPERGRRRAFLVCARRHVPAASTFETAGEAAGVAIAAHFAQDALAAGELPSLQLR